MDAEASLGSTACSIFRGEFVGAVYRRLQVSGRDEKCPWAVKLSCAPVTPVRVPKRRRRIGAGTVLAFKHHSKLQQQAITN